jgi:hypothetical protein
MSKETVFICSKFNGDMEHNSEIARKLCRMAMDAGYAPFAPHLLYPQILTEDGEDRELGIQCGLAMLEKCDRVWAYIGEGVSPGMRVEIKRAKELNKLIMILAEELE